MGVGASARIVELCLLKKMRPAVSVSLLAEYEDVLARETLFEGCRLNRAQREELLDIFLSNAAWCSTYFTWRPNLRDEADNHIVELAVASGASHILTWNVRDFASMELRFPLLIKTPPEFLKELK